MNAVRLGCLFIPAFRIQVHRRDKGLDPATPVVVVTQQGRHRVVAATCPLAEQAGIKTGMRQSQAEIACPGICVQEEEPERYGKTNRTLLKRLLALVPALEAVRLGLFYFGMNGLRWLYRDETSLMNAVLEAAAELAFVASAGIAGTRFSALLAAKCSSQGQIKHVSPGEDRIFLSPLPLSLLSDSKEILESLSLLGIGTVGEFAALPARAVARRYGPEGITLHRLARAEGPAHLVPLVSPRTYEHATLLEFPVENAEGLLFILSPLVRELLDTLVHEGRGCAGLKLTLRLDGGETLEASLLLGIPVTQPNPILDLLRLKLPQLQLSSGVVEARLAAINLMEASTLQGDLFDRVVPPSGMAVTLARLVETLSPEAVVTARLVDGYHTGQTFDFRSVRDGAPGLMRDASPIRPSGQKKRQKHPIHATTAADLDNRRDQTSKSTELQSGFRRIDPPIPLTARICDERPSMLLVGGRQRDIAQCRGPFRFETGWWGERCEKEYYRVTLRDDAELLMFQDLNSRAWFVEGVYD